MKTIERLHRSIGLVWTLVSQEGFEDWIWDSRFEVSFHSALDSGHEYIIKWMDLEKFGCNFLGGGLCKYIRVLADNGP